MANGGQDAASGALTFDAILDGGDGSPAAAVVVTALGSAEGRRLVSDVAGLLDDEFVVREARRHG